MKVDEVAGLAGSPWRIIRNDPKGVVKQTLAEFKKDRATLAGAGLAFYWFLAIFPALFAAVGVLDLLSLGAAQEEIRQLIELALPKSASDLLTGALGGDAQLDAGASLLAVGFGLLVALWGASTGMKALQEGVDIAYDISTVRSFTRKRLGALKLVAITGLLGGTAVLVLAFGGPIGASIHDRFFAGWDSFMSLWNIARIGLAGGCAVALVAMLYRYAPNRKPPPLRWLAPGGLVAITIMVATSLGFSYYVAEYSTYASTYGASLAGVVVLVLWLYLTALALLFGAELNALLERRRADG